MLLKELFDVDNLSDSNIDKLFQDIMDSNVSEERTVVKVLELIKKDPIRMYTAFKKLVMSSLEDKNDYMHYVKVYNKINALIKKLGILSYVDIELL